MRPATRAYTAWMGMRDRCNNPNNRAYHNYGGRGITVCERWDTFANFLSDMGDPPDGLSLDRRNNSKGYSKANCRWATRHEQGQNKRNNRLLTFKGETLCLNEWARRTGIRRLTLRWRMEQGWSARRVLTTPLEDPMDRKQNHMILFRGEKRCIMEWEQVLGLPRRCLSKRVARGWSIKRALTTPARDYPR